MKRLTVREAATRAGCDTSTVLRWIYNGKLRAELKRSLFNRPHYEITEKEFEQFMKRRE